VCVADRRVAAVERLAAFLLRVAAAFLPACSRCVLVCVAIHVAYPRVARPNRCSYGVNGP